MIRVGVWTWWTVSRKSVSLKNPQPGIERGHLRSRLSYEPFESLFGIFTSRFVHAGLQQQKTFQRDIVVLMKTFTQIL